MIVGAGGGGGANGAIVRVAEALLLESAMLVAVTIAVVEVETAGAVNRPVLDTVPTFADQLTATLLVPTTVALNCCAPPEAMIELTGDT